MFNNETKQRIANLSSNNDFKSIKKEIKSVIKNNVCNCKKCSGNCNYGSSLKALKFIDSVIDGNIKTEFEVFTIGNSKLPFLSYSALPGVTCPGAGSCLKWCYSFKAWRYPTPFYRQLQNTILENIAFNVIGKELNKIIKTNSFKNRRVDFRLYVDGDFKNVETMKNWFNLLNNISRISAYGYSKSLNIFKNYLDLGNKVPGNYVLNASQGGKFDSMFNSFKKYSFYRSTFSAYDFGKKVKTKDLTKDQRKEIRSNFPGAFICPGLCGSCTSIGHACGNNTTFKNVPIVIPAH